MNEPRPDTHHKALRINLDARRYGTFAEIGAGQEVARWFFHVGGASGTVAKTISAYDMAVSDAVYGTAGQYVSRQRLQAMLDREYALLLERLDTPRGAETAFFTFADTVAARSYSHAEDGRGWLGIRFQTLPHSEPAQIIIHARMWDRDNPHQQEALGILGVNLIYGAFYLHAEPVELIASLMDDLTRDRMEIDMIQFSSPAFDRVDNRLMSLQLVQQRLTNAAVFTAAGEAVEPAELIHRQPVLIERGSFRPLTNVTHDMLTRSLAQMRSEAEAGSTDPVVLMEMTLRNLEVTGPAIDHRDFLERVDTLSVLGLTVMISNYSRFYSVAGYLRRYTRDRVAMVLGVPTLVKLFEERFYRDLDGGLLEAMGLLFKGSLVLYVYPWKNNRTGEVVTADNFRVAPQVQQLYDYLRANGHIRPVTDAEVVDRPILPRQVLALIQAGDLSWEGAVPARVADEIKARKLFGYRDAGAH
jgi:hypothetical protein